MDPLERHLHPLLPELHQHRLPRGRDGAAHKGRGEAEKAAPDDNNPGGQRRFLHGRGLFQVRIQGPRFGYNGIQPRNEGDIAVDFSGGLELRQARQDKQRQDNQGQRLGAGGGRGNGRQISGHHFRLMGTTATLSRLPERGTACTSTPTASRRCWNTSGPTATSKTGS